MRQRPCARPGGGAGAARVGHTGELRSAGPWDGALCDRSERRLITIALGPQPRSRRRAAPAPGWALRNAAAARLYGSTPPSSTAACASGHAPARGAVRAPPVLVTRASSAQSHHRTPPFATAQNDGSKRRVMARLRPAAAEGGRPRLKPLRAFLLNAEGLRGAAGKGGSRLRPSLRPYCTSSHAPEVAPSSDERTPQPPVW